jgi:hypothetical protein
VRACVRGVGVGVGARVRAYTCARVDSLSSVQRACAILSVASLAPSYFSTFAHKRHDFRKKLLDIKFPF